MASVVGRLAVIFAVPRALADPFLAERERWILWLPVWFGVGIAVYFKLDQEPQPGLGVTLAALLAALALLVRRRSFWLWLILPPLFVALGFAASQMRTQALDGPVIRASIGPTTVTGRVGEIDVTRSGRRLLIERVRIGGLERRDTPYALRLNAPGTMADGAVVGGWVRLRAIVSPIPPPAIPGGFDYQRFLFFDGFRHGIGGVGRLVRPVEAMTPPRLYRPDFGIQIAEFRARLTKRIQETLPGDRGSVAAALLAGDQTEISDPVMRDMRDSGLAHILSISGLHIGLVAAFVFQALRSFLALFPRIALYYPIKKWAAAVAMVAVILYSVLAGLNNVPVVRSMLMCGFALLAILIDRKPLSVQVIAWSALVCLAITPDGMLGPSFQMSFGAVIALVAAGELLQPRLTRWRRDAGLFHTMLLGLGLVVATSVVATLATAPSSVFIFNRIAVYGVLANVVAVPLSSLVIMPAVVFAALLMPLGLEAIALYPMGWAIDVMLATAAWTARLPGAVLRVPDMPEAAFGAIIMGLLWLCLWRRSWRYLGCAGIVVGVGLAALTPSPSLLASADARVFALNDPDYGLILSKKRPPIMTVESWVSRLATERGGTMNDFARDHPEEGLQCNASGCSFDGLAQPVTWLRQVAGRDQACARGGIVFSTVAVVPPCPDPTLMFDPPRLARLGAVALTVRQDRIDVTTDLDSRGTRPWTARADTAEEDPSSGASTRSGDPAP